MLIAAEYRQRYKTDIYHRATNLFLSEGVTTDDIYHPKCYSLYTSVKKKSAASGESSEKRKNCDYASNSKKQKNMAEDNSMGSLQGSCVFCHVKRKKTRGKEEPLSEALTEDAVVKLRQLAHLSANDRLKEILNSGVDLVANRMQYHRSCRRAFLRAVETAPSTSDTAPSPLKKEFHTLAWKSLSKFIESDVIIQRKPVFCTVLLAKYKKIFLEVGGTEDLIEPYRVQHLNTKIKNVFNEKVLISSFNRLKGNFVHNNDLDVTAAKEILAAEKDVNEKCRYVALFLNSIISSIEKTEIPKPTSHDTLKSMSPEIPEELLSFFKILIGGTRSSHNKDDSVNRRAE